MHKRDPSFEKYLQRLEDEGLDRPVSALVAPAMKNNPTFCVITLDSLKDPSLSVAAFADLLGIVRQLRLTAAQKRELWPRVLEWLDRIGHGQDMEMAGLQILNTARWLVNKSNFHEVEATILDKDIEDSRGILLTKTIKYYEKDSEFLRAAAQDPVLQPIVDRKS